MFGFPESEMQEAEKLCDLFDRMRKYARDQKIVVVCATANHQPAPDVTDFTFTFVDQSRDAAMDYIGIIRTKERPLSGTLKVDMDRLLKYDMTLPIGFTPLRDGVTQTFDDKVAGFEVELPHSGIRMKLTPPTKERVVELIKGFDIDYEPVQEDDIIILGSGQYQVARNLNYFSTAGGGGGLFREPSEPTPTIDNPGGRSRIWGDGALTPEQGARKRRQSDVHVNGRPKKGWQK